MKSVMVIGTGRSGTSLTMQALEALKFPPFGDVVSASEVNKRGTGEAVTIKDILSDLNRAVGTRRGLLPDNWQSHKQTHIAHDALTVYFTQVRQAGANAAFKFTMSATYLPLMQAALEDSGLSPIWIWATRDLAGTVNSLQRAYGHTPRHAFDLWLQRSYYLLRDAPDETLLLPFEGWVRNLSGQIEALSDAVGCNNPDLIASASGIFEGKLAHMSAPEIGLAPKEAQIAKAVSELIGRKSGRLSEAVDRNSTDFRRLLADMSDVIAQNNPNPGTALAQFEPRLSLLSLLAAQNENGTALKQEMDDMTARMRALAEENTTLAARIAAGTGAAQAGKESPLRDKQLAEARANSERHRLALVEARRVHAAELADKAAAHDKKLARLQSDLEKAQESVKAAKVEIEDMKAKHDQAVNELRERMRKLTAARDEAETLAETFYRVRLAQAEQRAKNAGIRANRADVALQKMRDEVAARPPVRESEPAAAPLPDPKQSRLIDELREVNSDLERQLAEFRAHLDALYQSRSWRVTSPLRAVMRVFR